MTSTEQQVQTLVNYYREAKAAADFIGPKRVAMAGETPERIAANDALKAANTALRNHLEVYATEAAKVTTGSNLPTAAAIKAEKDRILAAVTEAIK